MLSVSSLNYLWFINSKNSQDSAILSSVQKIYDNLDSLVFDIKENSRNQKEIHYFIQSLSENIRELATLGRQQEKKLSTFLSTQLNTQASILELTSSLSKQGLIDKKTKTQLQNIEKNIKQLNSKLKK